jgi:trk system potassium uptake protein TrkA
VRGSDSARRVASARGGDTIFSVKIIIAGCGRTGSTLAQLLDAEHEVTVIDRTPDSFRRLGSAFGGKKLVGQGTDMDALIQAGIEQADVFVSVTDGDNRNIMAAQIAKEVFGVKTVLTRIYDPSRAAVYQEMGIHTLCTTAISSGLMRDILLGRAAEPLLDQVAGYLSEVRKA